MSSVRLLPDAPGLPRTLRAPEPDPEAQVLLRSLNLVARRSAGQVPSVAAMRRRWHLMSTLMARRVPLPQVDHHRIPGPGGTLALRLFRPGVTKAGAARPLFLWLHGGGFTVGNLATADAICRHIAQRSGAVVATVRYRLTPEHDLHAGRDDALAALDWLRVHAARLGLDAERIALGGDSAGGNIAAALAQRVVERGDMVPPRLQVLVYPATNLRDAYPSRAQNAQGYLLTEDSIRWFDAQVCTHAHDLDDPRLSPALAASLAGLPPALVLTAGFDPIRDDGLAYATRLRADGVPVQLLHYAGQFHGFLNFDAVLRAARDALDRIGDALAVALQGGVAAQPDCTLELGATARTSALLGPWVPQWVTGGLMAGEWLERSRNRVLGTFVPARLGSWFALATPWAQLATQMREQIAAAYAPLEAHRTFVR